jgi:IS5 family transposase
MLRTQAPGVSLWEAVLPEEVLPEEVARVDALLDDPAFFAGVIPFSTAVGSAVRWRSTCG